MKVSSVAWMACLIISTVFQIQTTQGKGMRSSQHATPSGLPVPSVASSGDFISSNAPWVCEIPNVPISLNDSIRTDSDDRSTWTEVMLETVPTSNQGLVDTIVGEDGNIYCAYFDDFQNPSYPDHKAVYVKRSTDGGATWGNPDAGANGFALYGIFMDRPSIVVFPTTATNYRIAIAVSAPYPNQGSPNDILVMWKDIGTTDDFTMVSVQNDLFENYIGPRLKVIRRPSQPALRRVVCASYGYSDGQLYCDYTDSNVTSWGNYSTINPATDQVLFWRADFVEDIDHSRLFCTWSADTSGTAGDHPRVITALSTNQGQTWFSTLYAISPSGWDYCAESDSAIASNAAQPDKTMMTVWSASQTAGSQFKICYTYQLLNNITVSGSTWNMGTVTFGTVYTDSDYDNSMPSIVEDNRYPDGGYRVAFIDQFQSTGARIRYTECSFSTPVSWTWPEVVSAPSADPAYSDSTAISSGVGFSAQTAYQNRRVAVWPDYRTGEFEVMAAWSEFTPSFDTPTPTVTPTPTITPSPTVTRTPTPTVSPSATPTPTNTQLPITPPATFTPLLPVPAIDSSGLLTLVISVTLVLLLAARKRN